MSKAILILDEMPNNCYECPLCICDVDYDYICSALTIKAKDDYTSDKYEVIKCKEWLDEEIYSKCPLKPLPKKKNPLDDGGMFLGKGLEGYNACIDEILGGEND